ncbi:MAG: hypothetical protein COA88_05460 [Kordia sp.]|nr:MAG: hypothetical protein COA88_05460 [Kordia sp.]
MIKLLPLSYLLLFMAFISCTEKTETEDATYFGGEIINPKDDFVLLYKDEILIDSIKLDDKNRFLHKFKDFIPGLYHFNHEEYQYVYIEAKDSIVFRLNTIDFDESLTFSGKGAHKNNFIINTFLANENHSAKSGRLYKFPPKKFSTIISGELSQRINMLKQYKELYDFSDDFMYVANAHIVYHFYATKERYPIYNKQHADSIDVNLFYDFRKNIDFNTSNLGSFYPYYEYLYALIDNLSVEHLKNSGIKEDHIANYTSKTEVIDSLIQNKSLKNQLLKNTTLHYLKTVKCGNQATLILTGFDKYNSDDVNKEKITGLVNAIKRLGYGNPLPDFNVISTNNQTIAFKNTLQNKPTVLYFWSSNNPRHIKSVHRKVTQYATNSNYNFVGISLDNNKKDWKVYAQKFNLTNVFSLETPKETREELLIQNINKVYVLDKNAKILSADLNIFDPHFNKKLKSLH